MSCFSYSRKDMHAFSVRNVFWKFIDIKFEEIRKGRKPVVLRLAAILNQEFMWEVGAKIDAFKQI